MSFKTPYKVINEHKCATAQKHNKRIFIYFEIGGKFKKKQGHLVAISSMNNDNDAVNLYI